jgi:hypothetical protein
MDPTSFVLIVLSAVAVVVRYIRAFSPLFTWIPQRWGWVPSAVFAVLAVLTDGLPTCQTWADVGIVAVNAIVVAALAAQAGLHFLPAAPSLTDEPPKS